MREVKMRKFHRYLGIIVVWFLAVQVLTGLILSSGDLGFDQSHSIFFKALGLIHFNWNPAGDVYRILLGLGALAQALTGIIIYFMIRTRSRKA